jgi:hypothetical protein
MRVAPLAATASRNAMPASTLAGNCESAPWRMRMRDDGRESCGASAGTAGQDRDIAKGRRKARKARRMVDFILNGISPSALA